MNLSRSGFEVISLSINFNQFLNKTIASDRVKETKNYNLKFKPGILKYAVENTTEDGETMPKDGLEKIANLV